MDFYDSLLQYDLEIQNKITERLNTFLKSINLLKNESLINQPNTKDIKYKHINILLDEINASNKFKTKLILNQKKQLLIRMNAKNKNKTKVNSKYYIYAKDMNQGNQKMDIYQIDDNFSKKDSNKEQICSNINEKTEFEKIFNQKKIYYENIKYNSNDIDIDNNVIDEKNNLKKLKCDINKIVCDIIKQNVKSIYNKKINEISLKRNNINNNIWESNTINNTNIKNNNYIKIDLQKKENKDTKDNKKYHNNHSTEKNVNFINYFNDNKKKSIKKDLRNSVTNNNGNHLKIKVYKNDILNFNNLNNNNNFNNLLIINNKIKSAKNNNINIINNANNINNVNIINININNNIQSKKLLNDNDNKIRQKELINHEKEENSNKNKKSSNKNPKEKNNNDKNEKNNKDDNNNKNGDQSHKKMIIRNIQRIQIKNIKLKNNPTGYNLTNICKKKLEDFENLEKNFKKSRQKERQCASPGEIAISSNKKINILKFKLGKNDKTPLRKNTERSFKKNNEKENTDNDNSIISILDDKTKDIYSQGIRFSSVKKKKNCDDMSCNDLSQICRSKKINDNNNFLIRNYKTNINRNNNNNVNEKNSFTKESEIDHYFIINRNNNNHIRKSLSKESGSHSYLPWNLEGNNARINKSNNKGNMIDSYLNHIMQIDKKNNFENTLKNINEYKKIKKNHEIHYICNENIIQNNDIDKNNNYNNNNLEQKYNEEKIKDKKLKKKNKSIYKANNNFRENKNMAEAGYNDTINNKDEPISYREGIKIKSKRRILSTRVHIRGVNSSKNFNNIL